MPISVPSPSFSLVNVHGTYRRLNGQPESGHIAFTVSTRVVSNTDDVIFAAGSSWDVQLDPSTGSVSQLLPAVDDPDNAPANWSIQVQEHLVSGKGETYWIQPRVADVAGGFNLRNVLVDGTGLGATPTALRGVPGGLAALDTDGDVVDAAGRKVTGTSAGTAGLAITRVNGVLELITSGSGTAVINRTDSYLLLSGV